MPIFQQLRLTIVRKLLLKRRFLGGLRILLLGLITGAGGHVKFGNDDVSRYIEFSGLGDAR